MPTVVVGKITTILDVKDKDYKKKIKDSTKDLKALENQGTKAGSSLKGLFKGAITGGVLAGFGKLVKDSVKIASNFQDIAVSLKVMTGSQANADKLTKSIRDMASSTPFLSTQLFDASKSLLAFGFEADTIVPTLRMLGDISAGTGKDIKELSIIFAQIKSAGRLMGQDLLQLINAGFNPLESISRKTGRSMRDLKDDMSRGLITFDMVKQSFTGATSEGGKFFNLMKERSETFSGVFSTFKDSLVNLGAAIGEPLLQPLTKALNLATDAVNVLVKANEESGGALAKLGVAGGALTTSAIALVVGKSLMKALGFGVAAGAGAAALPQLMMTMRNGKPIMADPLTGMTANEAKAAAKAAKTTSRIATMVAFIETLPPLLAATLIVVNRVNKIRDAVLARGMSPAAEIAAIRESASEARGARMGQRLLERHRPQLDRTVLGDIFTASPQLSRNLKNLETITDEMRTIDGFREFQENEERLRRVNFNPWANIQQDTSVTPAPPGIQQQFENRLAGAFAKGSVEAHRIVTQLSTNSPEQEIAKNTKETAEIAKRMLDQGLTLSDVGLALP
jgi:hypothetical protein